MDVRPQQPPEGKLIADALKASGLSIREASRRAGISYGRWRQITSGYQNVSPGSYAAVRAPAETLARMAAAVPGVTPERLEDEGQRPDAALALRKIGQSSPPPARAPSPRPAEEGTPPVSESFFVEHVLPVQDQYDRQVMEAVLKLCDGEGRLLPWPKRWEYIAVTLDLRHGRNGQEAGLIPRQRESELLPNH